jgi:type I restriction enzyme R subunit
MAYTNIYTEDRLVQATFAAHLEGELGWESIYAYNNENFGPGSMLGRADDREVVLKRDLRAAVGRINPELPGSALDEAVAKMTAHDFSRSVLQHNEQFHDWTRNGVPVDYLDASGSKRSARVQVIDFENKVGADGTPNNRFLAVRELWIKGLRAPGYRRRADLVCFINGLPVVFIELKAVYVNIRAGFDGNLADYREEHCIAHAFHHNAFLIVSNGDAARYGSITSSWEHFYEWKRLQESDPGDVSAKVLLNGMLAHDRLLDLLENFILFDRSKPGSTRKVVARNHQVLGVNQGVASVVKQEELKKRFPPGERLVKRLAERIPITKAAEGLPESRSLYALAEKKRELERDGQAMLELVEPVHPELGKLGVFWQTQGSGKSYSMVFFAEKVRRRISKKFTFVFMTDRKDLDDQIYSTFVGCGAAPEGTPRATSGDELERLLKGNSPYVFSLIHKFNKNVDPRQPYSERDDIIIISDEAHRTQSGKLAMNMRVALPNASFLGFTGTPLFSYDEITKRIFGDYVSRYDFKRSEQDGATVKLIYENRGEKLKVARLDLNDRVAAVIEDADLDPDQEAHLEKLLGKDYEVITAHRRLNKIARDFVEYASGRWESGKAMFVCIDKVTCARMWKRIDRMWKVKIGRLRIEAANESDAEKRANLTAKIQWMEETIIELIVSEAQGEIAEFRKWGRNIIPHRERMKKGFETPDGKRIDVETAFKDPKHPFRIAIVCAMWLTGFDVECLSTLYIDKPMRAHTLMQAIARANRVYPGKDFGLIVDYNGMLKSLRAAFAQYALGDGANGSEDIIAPIEDRVNALLDAIEATEKHLLDLDFNMSSLNGATGFNKIKALRDAVNCLCSSDENKRRFEIMARQVFIRFKALVMEPSAYQFAHRHDNIEAIYKKLSERRDLSDVTQVLKELHRIINDAIATAGAGEDQRDALRFDLSDIDLERLRKEFASKVKRKASAVQDIRDLIETKLAQMLANNPMRMDYYARYGEIVAEYNREKDRVTVEDTFARLTDFLSGLDNEDHRAAREGLSESELAIFDLLKKDNLKASELERVKQSSKMLLDRLRQAVKPLDQWTEKESTRAEVEAEVLDEVYRLLPDPPFSETDKEAVAGRVFEHLWMQSSAGRFPEQAA